MLALIAAVILVIVVPASESLLASATHQSAGHGEVSPPASEADPAAADRGRWAEATPANPDETVPGPGAFLGTLLKELAADSAESDAGIKKLVAGIPQVFPDLNKVLVAL